MINCFPTGNQINEVISKFFDFNVKYCFMTSYEVYYNTLKKDYSGLDVSWFISKPISSEELVKEIKSKLHS